MFLESPVFPQCPSFGYTSLPMYSVTPIERASGVETRNRNWEYPLHRFDCTVGPRDEEAIAELLEFWHAVGGMAYGFRFSDGVDYKSCRINEAISATDCPLLVVNGESPEVYQLIKRYTFGARTQDRVIYKPVQGTILIADGGVLKTEAVDYTIDYATGRVGLLFSPAGSLTWGGEFDVPVRFDSEFPVELVDKRIQSVSFALRELRRDGIS
jgi:uncharacterized protein (TIGR02217 family)